MTQKTILIIDDEDEILEEVKSFFSDEGFFVLCANSGERGLELFKKHNPDVLLLDLKLPDISGLSVLESVKNMNPRTKVLVNTGYVDQRLVEEVEKLGGDVFLLKPFDLIRLKDEVDRLIGEDSSG